MLNYSLQIPIHKLRERKREKHTLGACVGFKYSKHAVQTSLLPWQQSACSQPGPLHLLARKLTGTHGLYSVFNYSGVFFIVCVHGFHLIRTRLLHLKSDTRIHLNTQIHVHRRFFGCFTSGIYGKATNTHTHVIR